MSRISPDGTVNLVSASEARSFDEATRNACYTTGHGSRRARLPRRRCRRVQLQHEARVLGAAGMHVARELEPARRWLQLEHRARARPVHRGLRDRGLRERRPDELPRWRRWCRRRLDVHAVCRVVAHMRRRVQAERVRVHGHRRRPGRTLRRRGGIPGTEYPVRLLPPVGRRSLRGWALALLPMRVRHAGGGRRTDASGRLQ